MEQFMKNTASIDINSSNTIVLQGNGGNAATSFQEGNSANHVATTIETQPLNLIGDNLDNNADF